jgi:protein-S-isoprenylcysteine O-methyltransferase Ste14
MTIELEPIPTATFAVVLLCWFAFFVPLARRGSQGKGSRQARDRTSWIGISLQGLGFGIVWGVHRPYFSSLVHAGPIVDVGIGIITDAIAIGSVWLATSAIGTLGKEWSLEARLVEGHRLVTDGLYARVRHPIYTAMLGSLVATGLAVGHPLAIPMALVPFGIGTLVRVRLEEQLLRDAFGAQYDAYAARVPAVLPRLG